MLDNFIGQTIVKIDANTIYLSNGATIDYHFYETYFNTADGQCLVPNELVK